MNELTQIAQSSPEFIYIIPTVIILIPIILVMTKLFIASKNESIETTSDEPVVIKTTIDWKKKLSSGLSKTRLHLSETLQGLFDNKKIDEELLEKLHEALYRADIGTEAADKLVLAVKSKASRDQPAEWSSIKELLAREIDSLIDIPSPKLEWPDNETKVILIIGVNGVGKTTTIGKLASKFAEKNQKVVLCAADTYRAAAIDQLAIWAERSGCDIVSHQPNSDPAAVAYDAARAARARQADTLLVDTAGRLHTKNDLMEELAKIKRVLGKDIDGAPHETWLVVDATTGQNALQQIKSFQEVTPITGLVVTKLDGTAKGGIVVGAVDKFGIPVRYIGIGEKIADLREFHSKDYSESIL